MIPANIRTHNFSASGLGRATALDLVRHGGYVSILDISQDTGDQLIAEINSKSTNRARFFKTDVTKTTDIEAAIEGTMSWIKETGRDLAGVIASAGVGFPEKIISLSSKAAPGTLPTPMSLERAKFVLGINLIGTIDLVRLALPHLAVVKPTEPDGERGVVIMVSSSAAYDGQPGQVAYSASKGAIRSMTLPMARDLARFGIRAVTVAPSLFETNMTSKMGEKARKSLENVVEFPRRTGRAEEFSHLVRGLIENVMINGEVVRIDGAMRMPSKM